VPQILVLHQERREQGLGVPTESLDKTQRRILLLPPRIATGQIPGPYDPDCEPEKPVCPVDPEGGVRVNFTIAWHHSCFVNPV
jgi:hypothetical protein